MKFFPKVLIVSGLIVTSALGQTPRKDEPQVRDKIVIGTTEVLLDAEVRDKKGHLVSNLSAGEFEIYEDGQRQRIASARFVIRESLPMSPKSVSNRTSQTTPESRTSATMQKASGDRSQSSETKFGAVALVFDRLSPDARARAHDAALAFIGQGLTSDDFVGVFSIDQKLKVLQTFTTSEQLIRQGIDRRPAC